jgi:adenosylhomocysteine nucleosidase
LSVERCARPRKAAIAVSKAKGPVVAVTGLAIEAHIARGRGIVTVVAGARGNLAQRLSHTVPGDIAGVISFGIAGGLDPALAAGTCLIATLIVSATDRWHADERWARQLQKRIGTARQVAIAGVDSIVVEVSAKRSAFAAYRASALDMESHIAAAFAASRRVPFAALRVISDTAQRALPAAARSAMSPDGSVNVLAALAAYARAPRDLLALPRTALDAGVALTALRRSRKLLGPGLGFPDFDELMFDVL